VGGGGGVGVQDKPPAATVDANIMVILTNKHAPGHRRLAAVGLVDQMVHVTQGRPALAARPFTVSLGPKLDGAANVARDAVGVADIQGDRASVF
jgi:hypothetical protein